MIKKQRVRLISHMLVLHDKGEIEKIGGRSCYIHCHSVTSFLAIHSSALYPVQPEGLDKLVQNRQVEYFGFSV